MYLPAGIFVGREPRPPCEKIDEACAVCNNKENS